MRIYKIKDICRLEKGKQIDTTLLDDANPYKYINGGIKESGYYTSYNTEGEAVLVSEGGASCGYVNYINEKFWCGCHCYKLTECKFLPKYIYYALKGNQDKLMALRTGAAMPNIKKSTFQDMKLKLNDDFAEQEKVINELDKIQIAIDTKQTELIALDDLVKSRFIEMFGDIRISSIFPNIALENFAQIGSSKRVHAADYVESGVPFYRSKEIIELGNGQEPSVELFISKKQYESIKKTNGVPCKGDILMSAVGTIGKMWIVDGRKDFYYKDGNIISIHSEETNPIYLKEALANLIDDFKSANVAGSAYSALTIVKLKKMTVPMPPMSIQNKFAEFVKLIDKSKFVGLFTLNIFYVKFSHFHHPP